MACDAPPSIRVSGGPHAPAELRWALERELEGELDEQRLAQLRLLTSELVTNSVLHGGVGADGWVSARWSFSGSRLRVEVRDSGARGEPIQREPDYENGGGFGLFLVDRIASRWGVEHDPGLCVWFELD